MPQQIDYDALAQQAGGQPDYDALAQAVLAGQGDQYQGPDTFAEGAVQSLKETAAGVGRGFIRGLNPINAIRGAADVANTIVAGPLSAQAARLRAGVMEQGQAVASGDPEAGGEVLGNLALAKVAPPVARGTASVASRVPAGRILTATGEAVKGGITSTPIVGPMLKGAGQAAVRSWRSTAPTKWLEVPPEAPAPAAAASEAAAPIAEAAAASEATPVAAKPKLNAQQFREAMRKEFGAEKAARILYGPVSKEMTAAQRTAHLRRLTPNVESKLPSGAARRIDRELASSTADEAYAYARRARSSTAQEYFGEQLRAALEARMRSGR